MAAPRWANGPPRAARTHSTRGPRPLRAGRPAAKATYRYGERGIKGRHGFARERWRVPAGFAVPLASGLSRRIGAIYHITPVSELDLVPDVVVECTGVPEVVLDVLCVIGPSGIACLTGVSSGGRTSRLDAGAPNRAMVLENNVVFGTVNANRRHWGQAADTFADALADDDPDWLSELITRRVPLDSYPDAFEKRHGEIKTVPEI